MQVQPRAFDAVSVMRARSHGHSLVGVLVSSTILGLSALAFASASLSASELREETTEILQATSVARGVIEQLHGQPLAEVFARFNETKEDDPADGESPGSSFAFEFSDGRSGVWVDVLFPVHPGDSSQLREDLVLPELGMPRDLNSDGLVDELDHSLDYVILPVAVQVSWDSDGTQRRIRVHTDLATVR